MSEAKVLNELLKSLPILTDTAGRHVLLADAQGELGSVLGSVLGITYAKLDGYGASLLGSAQKGYALVIAFDTTDRSKVLVYTYSKPTVSAAGTYTVIHSAGGLDVSATNVMGTVALKGYTAYDAVVQHVLRFA